MLGPLLAMLITWPSAAASAASGAPKPIEGSCPWGHLADGNGHFVRCLKAAEAKSLLGGAKPEAATRVSNEVKSPATTHATAPAKPAIASPLRPSSPSPLPNTPQSTPSAAPAKPALAFASVKVIVDPVQVDVGTLALADRKLSRPKDRYAQCLVEHGGFLEDKGKRSRASVQVSFLARGRGRAEGVSVASSKGLTTTAARCVAEVVDRRPVGVPEEPMVGASVTIRFERTSPRAKVEPQRRAPQ